MKEKLKKIFKNKIFIMVVLSISFFVVGAKASQMYYANEISYTPTDKDWSVSNVDDALNSLYSIKTELANLKGVGTATASDILSGKTALVKGMTITGTGKSTVKIITIVTGLSPIRETATYTYDIKKFTDNWSKLTVKNFYGIPWSRAESDGSNSGTHNDLMLSYNATTGVLTHVTKFTNTSHLNYEMGYSSIYCIDAILGS